MDAARRDLETAVRLLPDFVPAWRDLGHLYNHLGHYAQAAEAFREVAHREPNDAGTAISLGTSYQYLGDYTRACAEYRRALSIDTSMPEAHSNLGTALQGLGDTNAAEAAFNDALRLAPSMPHALAGLSSLLELEGRWQEALVLLEPAILEDTADVELITSYARLKFLLKDAAAGAELLGGTIRRQGLSAAQKRRIHFVLGDCHDAMGQYALAFEHYRTGNELKPGRFDPQAHRKHIDALLDAFSPENMRDLPRSTVISKLPVFIVGMPRSGSSLVEQILAAHPDVAAQGERDDITRLIVGLATRDTGGKHYPDSISHLSRAAVNHAAAAYLERTTGLTTETSIATDKSPGNFFHLGLIELLFPSARIVHCRRNPVDTGLSCYFQDFSGQSILFAQNLTSIGAYYREYLRVMDHWYKHSSLPILDIDYEELVRDTESVTRRVLEFLALGWHEACLRHDRVDRTVLTASSAQVREAVYERSLGRSKHYEAFLGELIRALAEPHDEQQS